MRPLSESTARVAKSHFSRKYIALGRVVNAWQDIVGADLADYAQPVRLHYRRKKSCILEIACSNAHAIKLHYQKGLILQRIHNVFGNAWIEDLKFVPSRHAPRKVQRRLRKKRILEVEDNRYLTNTLVHIEDSAVKERLKNLGKSILENAS